LASLIISGGAGINGFAETGSYAKDSPTM